MNEKKLKYIVSVSYVKFEFDNAGTATSFAAAAKKHSIDDENVEIKIVSDEAGCNDAETVDGTTVESEEK